MARVKVEVPVENKPAHTQQAVHGAPHHANNVQHQSDVKTVSVKKIALIIGVIVLVIFIFNLQAERNRLQKQISTGNTSQTNDDVVAQISKTVELPDDETPQTRTIEDASRFQEGSNVLKEIQDGDVWIFYPKAGKQVFYRPSTKKVIFVVPLAPTVTPPQTSL